MLIEELILTNKLGLHIRAAAQLVAVSNRYSSHIELSLNEKKANAKSILNVMLLGATEGCCLSITIEGEDETEAMLAVKTLFEERFGEKE